MTIDVLTIFFGGGKWNNTHCISISKSLFGEKKHHWGKQFGMIRDGDMSYVYMFEGFALHMTVLDVGAAESCFDSLEEAWAWNLDRRIINNVYYLRLASPALGPCLFPKWRFFPHGSLVMSFLQIKIPWKSVWYKQPQRTHVTTGRSWRGWGWRV